LSVPGFRAIDHFGITVPDLDAAVRFFVDVLGAELWYQEGPFEDAEGTEMWDEMRIHPRSVERLAMLRLGPGATVELLEFARAGKTDQEAPEVSGHSVAHLALAVDDIEAAIAGLTGTPGVQILKGPVTVDDGPAAGLRWIYLLAPWGLALELIELPVSAAS
jgi:catechol 2,3-dioxygenase-like lactoylglutathione lyase family enzyme